MKGDLECRDDRASYNLDGMTRDLEELDVGCAVSWGRAFQPERTTSAGP